MSSYMSYSTALSFPNILVSTPLIVQSSKPRLYVQFLSSKTAALLSGRLCTVIIDRRSIIIVLISIIPTPTVMSLLQPPSNYQELSALLYKNVIITTLPSGQQKLSLWPGCNNFPFFHERGLILTVWSYSNDNLVYNCFLSTKPNYSNTKGHSHIQYLYLAYLYYATLVLHLYERRQQVSFQLKFLLELHVLHSL